MTQMDDRGTPAPHAGPLVLRGISAVEAVVGSHMGYSSWHTVTQRQIDAFADATGDHQWIHVDVERARASALGTTIAHGYLTLSLIPTLFDEILRIEGMSMAINYGANKLRFPSPVPAGAKVRLGVEVASLTRMPTGYQLATIGTVEILGAPKPASVVELLTLLVEEQF